MIGSFKDTLTKEGFWDIRRQSQTIDWFHRMISDRLMDDFYGFPERKSQVKLLEEAILNETITVSQAVENIFTQDK